MKPCGRSVIPRLKLVPDPVALFVAYPLGLNTGGGLVLSGPGERVRVGKLGVRPAQSQHWGISVDSGAPVYAQEKEWGLTVYPQLTHDGSALMGHQSALHYFCRLTLLFILDLPAKYAVAKAPERRL